MFVLLEINFIFYYDDTFLLEELFLFFDAGCEATDIAICINNTMARDLSVRVAV